MSLPTYLAELQADEAGCCRVKYSDASSALPRGLRARLLAPDDDEAVLLFVTVVAMLSLSGNVCW